MGGPFNRMSAEARQKLVEAMAMGDKKGEVGSSSENESKPVNTSTAASVKPVKAVGAKNSKQPGSLKKKKNKSSLLKKQGLLADSN